MSLSRNLMFHQRLKELEEFKAEFGHCNVPGPTITNKYNSLAGWSYQMRGSYKAFEEGRKSGILQGIRRGKKITLYVNEIDS